MSYRNPVTYVDSQSGKYFASAIQNISNTTAGVIDTLDAKAEAERKKKEAENLQLLNDTTKFNLDYLNSANLASKDFDLQPSLQPALSGLVDQAAKIKAQLFNSKNPSERSQLQGQLAQYENFFKGGGMKNLLESFQEKRELYSKLGVPGKAGSEGGIDLQKIDPKLSKFFLSTYNDRLPSDLGVNIVNNNGVFDIVLNSSGGVFGKESGYQQSLMGLMSAELPIIPNITAESEESLETEKLTKKGVADLQGQALSYLTAGGKEIVGSKTVETYSFNEKNRALFRKNMGRNVLATLAGYSNQGTLMDGPGTGFNSIESYYNNILRSEGDPDLEIGNAQGTSLDEKSLEIVKNKMLDKLEKRFENSIPKDIYRTPKETPNQENQIESATDDLLDTMYSFTDSKTASDYFVNKEFDGKNISSVEFVRGEKPGGNKITLTIDAGYQMGKDSEGNTVRNIIDEQKTFDLNNEKQMETLINYMLNAEGYTPSVRQKMKVKLKQKLKSKIASLETKLP
jgi:hypothetical protein